MPDALSQIGTFLSSGAGKAVETGAVTGTGLLQNFMANRQAQKKQNFVQDLITNPAKFSAYVKSFEQPLQAGLTADISRQTDAYGGERGLGSSPAIMKDVYAQALAPLLQQQQNNAQQTALQSLGIYENSPTQKPVDISSILKMLMMGNKPGANPTAGIDLGSVPNPGINLGDLGLLQPPSAPLPPSLVGGGTGFDPTTMEGG